MQTIDLTINHLTGNGWKSTDLHFDVDETIGVQAGRDVYATARGTVIKLIRKFGTYNSTWAHFTVDGQVHIKILVNDGKFVKSLPVAVGQAVRWE